MSNLKHVKELVKEAKQMGFRLLRTAEGPHVKLTFDTPTGEHTLTVSRSPSDWRMFQQNRKLFRKWSKA